MQINNELSKPQSRGTFVNHNRHRETTMSWSYFVGRPSKTGLLAITTIVCGETNIWITTFESEYWTATFKEASRPTTVDGSRASRSSHLIKPDSLKLQSLPQTSSLLLLQLLTQSLTTTSITSDTSTPSATVLLQALTFGLAATVQGQDGSQEARQLHALSTVMASSVLTSAKLR
jgi:hypothetical protein